MLDAYLYVGRRSPFGRYGGALSGVRPDDLMGGVIKSIVDEAPFRAEDVDDVIVGCGNQSGEDARCVARHALLSAGLPESLPGQVVQRNCASGLSAVVSAAHAVTVGELFIAGGVESMSRAPFVVGKHEKPFDRGFEVYDSTIGSRFPNRKITEQYGDWTRRRNRARPSVGRVGSAHLSYRRAPATPHGRQVCAHHPLRGCRSGYRGGYRACEPSTCSRLRWIAPRLL